MTDRILRSLRERLVIGRSALLVVDMQNDFCAEGGYISRLGREIRQYVELAPRICALIEEARANGVPVIWLMAQYDHHLIPKPMLARQLESSAGVCCGAGTWGAEPFGVGPAPDEVTVIKHSYSGFRGTELDTVLRDQQVDTLVFAGVQTNVCVESTLRDAHSLGYYPVVARDCVMSHMPQEHAASLNTIGFLFGDVIDSAEIAEHWRERALASGERRGEQGEHVQ